MKVYFLITTLFFTLVASSLQAQDSDCLSKLKTGTFAYDMGGTTVTVTRTKSKQIEVFGKGESKIINKVKWISDTEYELTYVKNVNAPGCLSKGDKMVVNVLECEATQYKVKIASIKCGSAEAWIRIVGD
ncbi:hypothetical protein KFE98_14615 [bacterium SCSIO 12741]|nr:hypothetical protein KFE98_14615 [bacterium SCSIO 12741]